ncbi:hypothetical protein JTE90_009371 [Oedothorax gibbosus]|uniref:Uncharacterized protein n=1 Tax=Oedothorax gibbosus TaxID=931172 RepID=A0AAV6VS54_9ARAC|nr:hypothetical protein JTE90_009371 [Oedothorax gibbosus]
MSVTTSHPSPINGLISRFHHPLKENVNPTHAQCTPFCCERLPGVWGPAVKRTLQAKKHSCEARIQGKILHGTLDWRTTSLFSVIRHVGEFLLNCTE